MMSGSKDSPSRLNAGTGYNSQGGGSDHGSARLSNVNTFKYNGPAQNAINIRKVSPQQHTIDHANIGDA